MRAEKPEPPPRAVSPYAAGERVMLTYGHGMYTGTVVDINVRGTEPDRVIIGVIIDGGSGHPQLVDLKANADIVSRLGPAPRPKEAVK